MCADVIKTPVVPKLENSCRLHQQLIYYFCTSGTRFPKNVKLRTLHAHAPTPTPCTLLRQNLEWQDLNLKFK